MINNKAIVDNICPAMDHPEFVTINITKYINHSLPNKDDLIIVKENNITILNKRYRMPY